MSLRIVFFGQWDGWVGGGYGSSDDGGGCGGGISLCER